MTNETTNATDISRLGFSAALAGMVLLALVSWQALDASYNPGFERWIVVVLVLEALLITTGIAAKSRVGASVGRGLIAGALFGGLLIAVGLVVWLLNGID